MKRKAKQRKVVPKSKALHLIPKQLFWISFIICAIISAYFIMQKQMQRFPITTVKVEGKDLRTSKEEIWISVATLLNKGFFGVNVNLIKEKLQKLPWVASVKVEKVWPDQITVIINEKVAIARWRGKGVITDSGDIIYSELSSDSNDLPIFWGNERQASMMLENYILILNVLQKINIGVKELEIMPDHGVRTILNNGIMLFLGQEGLLDRLNRFTLAYRNKLKKVAHKIDYIDLRYVNGVAIGWKDSIGKLYLDKFLNEDNAINA